MAVERRHRPIYTRLESDSKNPFHYLDIRDISKFKLFLGKNIEFLDELGKKNILARDFQRTYLSIHDKYMIDILKMKLRVYYLHDISKMEYVLRFE